jgi:tetratricopeptide (TPR) repeat protein
MAEKPQFVYGQRADDRSVGRMFLGLIVVESVGYREKRYRPDWRRLAVAAPIATLALWVLTAEANVFKEKYINGVATTSRADMYLYLPDSIGDWVTAKFMTAEEAKARARARMAAPPARPGRDAHLRKKGAYYVEIAKAALARQDFSEFAKFIGTGAQMAPADLEAQRLCADLFFALGRPLDSFQLLEDSLEFSKQDLAHVRHFVQRCLMMDQDARVLAAAARLLPDPALSAEVRQELELARAQSFFLRGDYVAALAVIRERSLTMTADGYLLNCQALWESGERAEAWKRLEEALRLHPSAAPLLEMKARWHKETGNFSAARDCLELLAISDPRQPAPVVQSLHLLPGEANRARREQVVERCIREFGSQEQAMLDVARFGNETADTALTQRMLRHAEARRFPNRERFVLVHVECMINAGRVRETILMLDELHRRSEREQWLPETRTAFEALRAVAYFADGQPEAGMINLRKTLENPKAPPQLLLSAARKLIAAGRTAEADEVLIRAHLANESNQAVLMQIVRLKLDTPALGSDLETYLRRLMATRRPPKEVLTAAQRKLGSDAYLYSEGREKLLDDIGRLTD